MRVTFFTVFALVAAVVAQAPYTGPCSDTACGVESENCDAQGRQCFPFPNIAPALREGCVCGSGLGIRLGKDQSGKARIKKTTGISLEMVRWNMALEHGT
ncbi:hypothetical protein BDP55DRAFT_768330 [Colletotrichum godetiae]|uniref:Uncharacterized protein n=1 Tax=Colletotrichum godetiae TaxID=1209918 RepID=A0AAJ0ALX1_9PEZI|nr:uncharacterized protein BDP55DRAFT_768330 [Colletotrichum godetiae]KAK1675659.1 hypothetical protein BDP55DRAFT_768330 [Colletotrichum godetiae]